MTYLEGTRACDKRMLKFLNRDCREVLSVSVNIALLFGLAVQRAIEVN